jgi:SAM-dependent methyltransferase
LSATEPTADAATTDRAAVRAQVMLLGLAEGFFYSSVLFALLRLDVFEQLGEGSKSVDELAKALDVRGDYLRRLLTAAVALELLEATPASSQAAGPEYRIPPAYRGVLLRSAGENYLGDWILNLDYFRDALTRLDQAVATGSPVVDPGGPLGDHPEQTREFTLAMHNYAALRGRELTRYLDTSGCRSLLDLGCGPGTYAFNLGAANPELALTLLDLPGVLAVTREVEARYELQNEITYLPLDALHDEIPGTYDLVLVSHTLHMLGEEASRDLVRRLYDTVAPGGSLVVQAQFLQDDRREIADVSRRWPIFLDLLQLCITARGRNHTVTETETWMRDAGFERIEYTQMTLLNPSSFLRGYRG